jgi:hypothetical protein
MTHTAGSHEVQVARDGKSFTGTYEVEGDAVFVEYCGDSKIVPLDGLDAESRARMTLGMMVDAPPPADGRGHRPDGGAWSAAHNFDDREKQILMSLGASVLLKWNDLSREIQRDLFEAATTATASEHQERVRQQLAVFLHDHKDDRS